MTIRSAACIRTGSLEFTVIGTFQKLGSVLGQDQDNFVIIPMTTYLKLRGSRTSLTLEIKASGGEKNFNAAQDEARVIMRSRRHDPPGKEDSFFIGTSQSYIALWQSISGSFFAVFVMVSSISAVVGGIVIMNVMLVSVTQRTREIGVRRAMGATKSDILHQFLAESLLQCLIGGAIGIAIGFACALALRTLTSFPASVKTWVALLGLVAQLDHRAVLRHLSGAESGRSRSRDRAANGDGMTRQEVFENLSVALDTLRARKVRSGLTILGIVIGVTTVIAVARIIDGLNGEIKDRVVAARFEYALHHPHPADAEYRPAAGRRSACGNIWKTTMRPLSKHPVPRFRTRRCSPIGSTSTIRRMRFDTATRTWSVSFCAACSRDTSTPSRCSPWPRGGSFRLLTKSTRATWW